jgi:alkanesulfonate monooxygenase SsuD/methylene tetrahydromethanopterin reductase-like flavin-dependent oxidoreductase (luciferase family)
MAAALARRTERAALVVLGTSLALYNPPTRVAEELALLDCVSGGRVVAGFPIGTPQDTCFAYGQDPSSLRDKYHEAHDLILRAWRERAPFAFNGRFTQLPTVGSQSACIVCACRRSWSGANATVSSRAPRASASRVSFRVATRAS